MMKPHIDGTSFGSITIDGITYENDVVINLAGDVYKRKKKLSKAIYGSSHTLSKDEAKFVYEESAKRIIIGSGQYGLLNISKEAESYFNQLRDTHLGYNPETGMMISGVTPNTIGQVAQSNLTEFMGTEAGRQAVQSMKYLGDTRSDAEIAYDVLLSRGTEYVRKNIGFSPAYTMSGSGKQSSSVSGSGIEYFAPSEPIAKEFTNYKEGLKTLEELDKSGADPDKREKIANLLAPAVKQEEDIINTGANNLLPKLGSDIMNLVSNTMDEEDGNNFIKASQYAVRNDVSLEDAYTRLYGFGSRVPEEYYRVTPGTNRYDYDRVINKYRRKFSRVQEAARETAEQLYNTTTDKSTAESIVSIPQVKVSNGVAYSYDRGTNNWVPNNYSSLYNIVLNNVTPQMAVPMSGTDDPKLKTYNESAQKIVNGGGIDKKGNFLHVITQEKDKNDILKQSGNYKVYLPTYTQNKALAEGFKSDADIFNYVKFSNPHVEAAVESKLGTNKFEIPIAANEKVVATRNSDGSYKLSIPSSGSEISRINPEDISNFIYQTIIHNTSKK